MRSSGKHRIAIVALVALVASLGVVYLSPTALAEGPRTDREDIFIQGDRQFNPANGVRFGSGTKSDPFVISGWNVNNVFIRDTGAHMIIKNNNIAGQLVLNWNGDRVTVVDNYIGDLRVNQNVKRTGEATSGRIAHNTFGIVGQLRHFDGVFEHNVVKGNPDLFGGVFENQSVQFDGFHGSRFRNNTINGFVDVKLHGHHHGSGFDAGSHYHGAEPEHEGHGAHAMHSDVDHTKRYHQVFITNNKIISQGQYALRWTDQAHAGDDRTAPSETNEELNKEHIHHTKIHLTGNQLVGAGLMVDIFNADDERHIGTETGLVEIRNNTIELARETQESLMGTRKDGITIRRAVDATVKIAGNRVIGESAQERDVLEEQWAASDAGIRLDDVDKARIFVTGNRIANMHFGVLGARMTKSVNWWIAKLSTNAVAEPVYYDNSVKNQPHYEP